jgi:hypothetical protein
MQHCRSSLGAHADYLRARGAVFDPRGKAGNQGTVSKGYDNCVDGVRGKQFDTDRARAFGDCILGAIFDEDALRMIDCLLPRILFGNIEISIAQRDLGAERAHSLRLGWIYVIRNEYLNGDAPAAANVGHGLSEVAGGGTHNTLFGVERAGEEIGASALEAADGIGNLDLHEHAPSKRGVERPVLILRTMEEGGINQPRGFFNVGQV